MRISYDKTVDALKIKFNDKPYENRQEVLGGVMLDLTAQGELIAIEILYASTRDIDPYEIVSRYHPTPIAEN